jgi:hypothetical protein
MPARSPRIPFSLGGVDLAWLLVVGLASSAACVLAAHEVGVTFDEPAYLRNGLHFWHTGSHRELMKLGTMPLPPDVQTFPIAVAEWWRGERFDVDARFHELLSWMRHGNLVFWWLLLGSALLLGRELGGPWGGRLAVAAIACEPNLLAHAALATTDIAITATLMIFTLSVLHVRDGPTKRRIVWPGILLGVALLAKASAAAFGPIILLAAELSRTTDQPWRPRARRFVVDSVWIGAIAVAVAVIGCGSDFQRSDWFVRWAGELPEGTYRSAMTWLAERLRVFGNAFEAFSVQWHHNLRGHGQYLLGEWSFRPFWWYFPTLLLIKLPAPTLAAAGWLLVTRPARWFRNPALLAALLLLVFSLKCRVQLGIRMQFPMVALLMIGLLAEFARLGARARVSAAVGVAGLLWATATVWPHGLTYANRLWGGPASAYLLAADSNYDWGQGLPELDRWHAEHGRPGMDVWYFGQDPMLATMPVRNLPLHGCTIHGPDCMPQFIWGRTLAVGTSVVYGPHVSPSHTKALEYILSRPPIARTRTFLIFSFQDVPPPAAVAKP